MNGRRARLLRQQPSAGPGWKKRVRQAKRRWYGLTHRQRKKEQSR